VIDPATANDFILGYKDFLLFAAGAAGNDQKGEFFDELAFGRNALLVDPGLLSQFRAESAEKHEPVFLAIANMQVSDWIYLRDTSRYYVFIKADQRSACAVRGLTETVKKACTILSRNTIRRPWEGRLSGERLVTDCATR